LYEPGFTSGSPHADRRGAAAQVVGGANNRFFEYDVAEAWSGRSQKFRPEPEANLKKPIEAPTAWQRG